VAKRKTIRIGGAAGMWGDSSISTPQLLAKGDLDIIIYEMLAEVTMGILARAKAKDPGKGYAVDFVDVTLALYLKDMKAKGVRVVTNAGGVNPRACADAIRALAKSQGIDIKVAAIDGDDLTGRMDELSAAGIVEMTHGTPPPARTLACHAYLGAAPIADALDAGADIVVTGRCVDSALVLGPLIHAFDWALDDYAKLAQGSLAGHLLECGAQSTGGLMTDWEATDSWVDIGYPIAEVSADSSFVLTKAPDTDGIVSIASASEQLIYEIGDPHSYILPDVVCDFAEVNLEQIGPDRVKVTGARGAAPTPTLKAGALEVDGYRLLITLLVVGRDAARKADRMAATLFARLTKIFAALGWEDFDETSVETLGAESNYGPASRMTRSREVVLKIGARHARPEALGLLGREAPSMGISMAQGVSGGGGGRARATPYIRLHSLLVPREMVTANVILDGEPVAERRAEAPRTQPLAPHSPDAEDAAQPREATVRAPLMGLAYARSGDKGDGANIGVIARHPDFVAAIAREVTSAQVKAYLAHFVKGEVRRYAMPGVHAFNFTLDQALGGGGLASLRYDPQGKAFGQMLLDLEIDVPESLTRHPAYHAE